MLSISRPSPSQRKAAGFFSQVPLTLIDVCGQGCAMRVKAADLLFLVFVGCVSLVSKGKHKLLFTLHYLPCRYLPPPRRYLPLALCYLPPTGRYLPPTPRYLPPARRYLQPTGAICH